MASINLSGSISATGVSILGNASIIFASDANHTLSVPEYTNNFLEVTSSVPLTVTRNLIAPLVVGQSFVIQNNTTGGQAIQVIGASGTGIIISNGLTISVVCDGTNYLVSTASSGGAAGGDLSGTYPNPTVRAIQGHAVSTVVPQDGYALVWDGYQNAYVPTSLAGNNAYLNQPTWFIDSINGFDGYTGTSATFISGTVGPIQTCAELLRRYGTRFPVITQSVTVTLLNDVPTSDPWLIQPTTVQGISYFGTNFTIIGTLIQTGTATIGTFTPQTHGSTQNTITASGQSGAFWTPFVGNLVQDTTVSPSAWFWVTADAGTATAKISEPLKLNAVFIGGAPPYQTIANGNSLVMYRPTNLYVPVANGNLLNPGIAFQTLTISGGSCEPDQTIFDRCSINCLLPDNIGQSGFTTYSNCDFSPNILSLIVFGNIYGGSIRAPSAQFTSTESSFVLDGDVVCTGTVGFAGNSPTVIGRAGFFGTLTSFQQPFFVRVVEQNYGQPIVWGTASFNVLKDSTLTFNASFTAASQWLSSGALTIDGLSTANPWNATANIFHAPVSITPANVDVYGSLQNPLSGSKIYKEGAVGVTTYLTQTAWFVDPQNVTTTASDSNTGLTSGAALRTKAEIIRRWGTNSPIFNGINVVITYLSADTNGNDPGIFTPVFLVGSSLTHTAALPAPAFTGTLLSVTPKNMVANQALQSTFTTSAGSLTRYMLLVNTTRGNSRAILQRNTSGGTWQISQPVVPYPGTGVPSATEVNTWANGDVINGYIPLVVNLAVIGGVCRELLSPFSPFHIVQQLTQFSQAGSFPPVVVDDSVYSLFSDCMNWNITVSGGRTSLQCITLNCYFLGCLALNGAQVLVTLQVLAGVLHDFRGTGVLLASDTILEGHGDIQNCPSGWGPLFIDTGVVLRAEGVNGSNIAGVSVYGPGNFNQLAGTTTYLGTAAANFPIANITINGSTTAYSINNTTLNSNITLSAANLDAPAGPAGFGGNAFIPGVGGITNTTSTQSSALTQAAWFIDPVNGFDGYTGTNATFTSGTTGPLRTFAQLFSRWGSLTPLIAQPTTITLVNSGNVNDPWCATPIFINTGKITLQGTPTVVITSTIGTFTPAVRGGANTLATITSPGVASWATHVGSLIHDTTANATFWIHADLGGGVAQITNAVATPLAPGSFTPAPVTLVNGDTIQLLTPPTIFVTDLTYQGFGTTGILSLSQLTVSSSTLTQTAAIDAAECFFTLLVREIKNTSGSLYSSCIVAALSGLSIMTAGKLGQFSNFGAGIQGSSFDGDIIFAGNMNFTEGVITLRSVYLAGLFLNETPISVFQTQTSATYGPSGRCLIWGPGTLAISSGAQCDATAGGTAVQKFVNTGGLQIDGVATANVWNSSSNAFSAPVSTTPANLDFFGSFQNPTTGSAIHINNVANPNYLTQATWFIDPALGFDGYSGTNATFTSGTTGPLKTWAEIIRRYGTNSPRLRQSTTYTFVSSHTDNTDPVYFMPYVENGAVVSIKGTAPTTVAAIFTLNAAKNRTAGSNAMLSGSFSAGSPATGMMVENTTGGKSSRAIIHTSAGGSNWNLTQPLVKTTVPFTTLTPAEVDTWASTDTVNLLTLVKVNIALFAPTIIDVNGGGTNFGYLYQLQIFDPGGVGNDPCVLKDIIILQEVVSERGVSYTGNTDAFASNLFPGSSSFINTYYLTAGLYGTAVSLNIIGGGTNAFVNMTGIIGGSGVSFDADFIAGGFGFTLSGGISISFVFLDSNCIINGPANVRYGTGSYGGHVLYGTAAKTTNFTGNARGRMSGTFTAGWTQSFLVNTGVQLNGLTTAYSVGSGTGATLNGGITITPANLDAPQGPSGFGGTAFILGGASITNGNA